MAGTDVLVALDSRPGRLLMATVVLGSAVASLMATVVNVALPTLARDLGASAAQQTWIVNAHALTLAALILIGGSLGDRFGRVRVYRIGVVWFAMASLLCALAWSVEALIAFRLVQGIGGALLTPGSLAIIESSLRREDRGRGVGTWSGMIGIAGAIGPLLGGALVEYSWRVVFVLNVPLAVIVLVLSRWVPETRAPEARDAPLDNRGAALAVLALGGISYALVEGPGRGLTPLVMTAAGLGLLATLLLWRHESGRAHAMVPIDLFANRTFTVANGLTFTIYGGMGVLFFLLSIHLQVTAGWSPIASGAALLPVTGILLLASARAGAFAARHGPRGPLTIGPLVVAAGMLLMTRIGPSARFVQDVLPAVLVFGLGLAGIVAPVTSAALDAVPDSRAGVASGVNNAVARTGGLLAVAAVPGLVGLTGDALSVPALLQPGFVRAMFVSASIVGASGVAALVLLRSTGTPHANDAAAHVSVHHHRCPIDGSATAVVHAAALNSAEVNTVEV